MPDNDKPTKKKNPLSWNVVVREARELIWAQRWRLSFGFLLMIVNRTAGLVLPASSKYLIDDVVGKGITEMLIPLAIAVGAATVVQAGTTFSLSQLISIAAQRVIMNMRVRVQDQITRLPIRFFDDTKTGELISRIMTDPEGVRNLVGTGIIQLVGGIFTAAIALGVLFYLNWRLTSVTLIVLAVFGGAMAFAFTRLRPIFRVRREINAEVTARLNETLGGIRIVKAYGAEGREQQSFSEGVDRLFRNIAKSITGISAVTAFGSTIIGMVGVIMIAVGGRSILEGNMTLGDFVMYVFFTGLLAAPIIQMASIGTQISEAFAGLDRIREVLSMETEDAEDETREPLGETTARITFEEVIFAYKEGVPVLKNVS
ncbi:MAG: ABC transporter ATP-binding protein, partial [Rhodothermales bacterium]|nr:ABC transporter ATP-binding protein [Rhodothermales bacterium]